MSKHLKYFSLILLGMVMQIQSNFAQKGFNEDIQIPQPTHLFLRLHTLSIHVRDTVTHDSVFHFLADRLKLPVYYYPVTFGNRKYAGVYAGNIILEPCGPYSDYSYASNDFRAIFFGLTFEPVKPLSVTALSLTNRKIKNELVGSEYINLTDADLCGENITVGCMDKPDKINDREKMDSLRYILAANSDNELGIEYVKEIAIGYKDNSNLRKWNVLISPSEFINNEVWMGSDSIEFHFIGSTIKEVQSLTFKVRSLEQAKRFLLKNNLGGTFINNRIELDKRQTFGLSMYITADE